MKLAIETDLMWLRHSLFLALLNDHERIPFVISKSIIHFVNVIQ
jgi:hypothetical protein